MYYVDLNSDLGESFGAYSYEQARTSCGLAVRWQDVFRSELLPYRRLYAGVRLT